MEVKIHYDEVGFSQGGEITSPYTILSITKRNCQKKRWAAKHPPIACHQGHALKPPATKANIPTRPRQNQWGSPMKRYHRYFLWKPLPTGSSPRSSEH